MKERRNPATIHPPLAAYSHQIEIRGPERLLILSGQVGRTVDGRVPEDPIEQLKLALENLKRNLTAAGMEIGDIVKVTLYVSGSMDAGQRRQATAEFFGGHEPCMTVVFVAGLATPAYRVEVDAWASRAWI